LIRPKRSGWRLRSGRLAGSGLAGDHANIGIALGPMGDNRADLAARIVAALMERLT
jgi:hypothetical protein